MSDNKPPKISVRGLTKSFKVAKGKVLSVIDLEANAIDDQ